VNGLNDFDALDYRDYNDPNGNIQRTLFREDYIYMFKELRTAWTTVNKSFVLDDAGLEILATSKHLLNDIRYALFEGGVGNNPESVFTNAHAIYAAYPNAGVFVRIAQNGTTPISQLFNYDQRAREILSAVAKHNLRCYGVFDRVNDEAIWSVPDYDDNLYNGGFDEAEWDVGNDTFPEGTTYAIVTPPVHGTVTMVDGYWNYTPTTDYVGTDSYTYSATLPDSTVISPIKDCITVTEGPFRPVSWRHKESSNYCIQRTIAWRVRGSSTYCVQRVVAWRVKSSSVYCLQREVGWRVNGDSNYCVQVFTPGTVGNILIDFQNLTDLNIVGFVSTPGLIPTDQIVYPGVNFYPNDGTPAANCWALSSDQHPPNPTMRFAFNITKLLETYPSLSLHPYFDVTIKGRKVSAGTVNGAYSLKDATSGDLTMSGSPGTYLPGTTSPSIGSPTSFTANVVGGGDGSYNITNGANIITLRYDVATQSVTATIA
jgi:hypothetical protein